MADVLTKLAYETFQQGKSVFGLAHKALNAQLFRLAYPAQRQAAQPLKPELLFKIQQRLQQLMEADWQDAERGVYPASLLFDGPWSDFFRYYPMIWLEMPEIWERSQQKRHQEFAPEIDTERYPSYYLQNFHHQTNGYLSEQSANLYDLQVEILFSGSADAMRRRILAPLKQSLKTFANVPAKEVRVLDVACGTGRTLKTIRATLPQTSLYGVDLSPAYLRKANQVLSEIPGELPQLMQANAEELPYRDHYFHALTCVFLFHELPPEARQRVIEQSFRVLQPGGSFILCDSIQISDSPELEPAMEGFHETFHEPYYKHYMRDDLVARLEKAGFQDIATEVHFMSKYLVARKPA
uniref:class I SAM-dependent methyltransferase n=1 Tax=Trichocoleus desertorum TaxID=1481672 RepID=UPI0025B4B242|nr:class I SAM-dependent methyltransferase [Trichocoleus desertorum]